MRGLALRSLCSLRLESILEYVEQPLRKSLSDLSAYVRKAAVMGILKVRSTAAMPCRADAVSCPILTCAALCNSFRP